MRQAWIFKLKWGQQRLQNSQCEGAWKLQSSVDARCKNSKSDVFSKWVNRLLKPVSLDVALVFEWDRMRRTCLWSTHYLRSANQKPLQAAYRSVLEQDAEPTPAPQCVIGLVECVDVQSLGKCYINANPFTIWTELTLSDTRFCFLIWQCIILVVICSWPALPTLHECCYSSYRINAHCYLNI